MTNICRKPEIPIPCPTCKGKGVGTDGEMCWSCKGSCVLMVSETAYASIVGDSEKEERHRIYTPQEKIILLGKGTLKSKLELLRREGYNDRTVRGISKKYIKLLGEENVREHKAGA